MEKVLIVCDLGHLKIYEVKRNPSGSFRIDPLKEIDIKEAHERLGEIITDKAGLFGMGGERGSLRGYGEKNTEEELNKKIVKVISEEINRFYLDNRPRAIYFSAPKKIHSQIVENLQTEARDAIKKAIKADLTKHTKEDLIERFLES